MNAGTLHDIIWCCTCSLHNRYSCCRSVDRLSIRQCLIIYPKTVGRLFSATQQKKGWLSINHCRIRTEEKMFRTEILTPPVREKEASDQESSVIRGGQEKSALVKWHLERRMTRCKRSKQGRTTRSTISFF